MKTGAHTLIKWSGKVIKGGGRGHGFVTLPKDISEHSGINHGDRVILNINNGIEDGDLNIDTFYRVNSRSQGFYIPKEITQANDLLGKRFHFSAYKEEGFKTSISADKQVIIPYKKLDEFQISDRDIINLRVTTKDGKTIEEPVIVKYSDRADRTGEHIAIFRNNDVAAGLADAKIEGKLEKVLPDQSLSSDDILYMPNMFPLGHIGNLGDGRGILFKGQHTPIEVPLYIDVRDRAHYLGAYFADGTKKGHAWKMSASTPEQAMYYNSIYEKILPNEEFKYQITYSKTPSDTRSDDKISRDLKMYWEDATQNSFKIDKVVIVDAKVESAPNRNEYGSLEIRNDKGLVMQFHQKMLDQTIEIIENSNDRRILWDFVHGILEGDGFVAGGAERFGIGIACELNNYQFIQGILDELGIQYRTDTYKIDSGESDGVKIEFGLFEILKNFSEIKDNAFQFYPKRAERLFDRMKNQNTVRHILGEESGSNFVRSRALEFDSKEIRNFFTKRE